MDLNINPQEAAFRDDLRAWLLSNVPGDWKTHRLLVSMEDRFQFLRAWQKRVEAGWAGVAWPKEYGGRGARADFKVLQYIVIRTEILPRNPSGKILKKVLRENVNWGNFGASRQGG